MTAIIIGLIVALIIGSQPVVDLMLDSLTTIAFYAETHMATSLTYQHQINFQGLANLFFTFGVSLIILKFLKKGFEVYVGWQEGDPDLDPLNLVVNFIKAILVAMFFPILYRIMFDVVEKMLELTINELNILHGQQTLVDQIVNGISNSLFQAVAGLIIIICYCILYLNFLMRGIEMLIIRIGMPIACVGLLDGSQGVFQPYVKKIIQNAVTVLIQICLVKLSISVLALGNLFYAIGIVFVAMKTPKFLQEFMIQTGGGGSIMNTVYHTSRIYQMAKSVIAKAK